MPLLCPRRREGGPIALLRDGDIVTIDNARRTMDAELGAEEWERRRAGVDATAAQVHAGRAAQVHAPGQLG